MKLHFSQCVDSATGRAETLEIMSLCSVSSVLSCVRKVYEQFAVSVGST